MPRVIDRDQVSKQIGALWKKKRFADAEKRLHQLIAQHPDDSYGHLVLAQTWLVMFAESGRERLTEEESNKIIASLESAIAAIDVKEIKHDATALNEAAFIHVILASAYQNHVEGSKYSINQKIKKHAEWVTKREFPQRKDYFIDPETMAQAYVRLATALERMNNDHRGLQSALVRAASNFRRAGNEVGLETALQVHEAVFGYQPISLQNIDTEFPKFVDRALEFEVEEDG